MEGDRCRDLRSNYAAYAAGLTDGLINERIQLHLGDGCPGCAFEIEELMEAFHAVPLGLAVQPFSTERAAALVETAKTTRQEEVETPILFPESNQLRLWQVLTTLAAVAVVAAAIWGRTQALDAQHLRSDAARAGQRSGLATDEASELRDQVSTLSTTLESAADPHARVLDLSGAVPGRAFLDVEGSTLVLSVDPLGPPGAGRLHHVWLLGAGEPDLLSALPPAWSVQGGQVAVRLPEQVARDAGVLITLEATGAVPSEPSDEVVLRSK